MQKRCFIHNKVRDVVEWIKSSLMRSHGFYKCFSNITRPDERDLCLDVSTWWSSIYLMLESAEPYAMAMNLYASVNLSILKDYPLGLPHEGDWINVR